MITSRQITSAKVAHLGRLPQGQPERERRVLAMVRMMDEAGFGGCTNFGECQEACPKEISVENIARLNRDYVRASLRERPARAGLIAEEQAPLRGPGRQHVGQRARRAHLGHRQAPALFRRFDRDGS